MLHIKENKKNINCLFIIITFIISVFFLIINHYTRFFADDYYYMTHTIFNTDQTINDFGGSIQSVKNYYFDWSGRIEGHFFITVFSFMPLLLFDIINTLAYIFLVLLIYKLCVSYNKNNIVLYVGIHILLWFSVPDYGQVMFWLCGTTNYLWPSLIVLLMIYTYRFYSKKKGNCLKSRLWSIPLFILGLLSGWAMENMSAGMLVILTLYLIFFYKYKIKINSALISGYAGSLIGFALLILAPGNRIRAAQESGNSFIFKFAVISYYFIIFIGILLILWGIHCLLLKHIKQDMEKKKIFLESSIYMVAAFASSFCMLAAPTSPERTWFIVAVYGIISIGVLHDALSGNFTEVTKQIWNIVILGSSIIFIIQMADTVLSSREIYIQEIQRENYILEQKELGNYDIEVPIFKHKYPFKSEHDVLSGLSDVTTDPNHWINQSIAGYYGINSIRGYYP